jgi:2-isopropylmalate synthase
VQVRTAARCWLAGEGNGPVDAFVSALSKATGVPFACSITTSTPSGRRQARAAAYLELRIGDQRTLFGVGIDANIVTASMKAVLSGPAARRRLETPAHRGRHRLMRRQLNPRSTP